MGFVLLLSQRFSRDVVLALSTLTVCVIACSDSTRGPITRVFPAVLGVSRINMS